MSTGSLTAQRRLPLQQLTMFSYSIRNFLLIGAGAVPGIHASAHAADMYDLMQCSSSVRFITASALPGLPRHLCRAIGAMNTYLVI